MKKENNQETKPAVVKPESKYSMPSMPSWMPEDGVVWKECETTATDKTPGHSAGETLKYQGQMITPKGLQAFVEHNPEMVIDIINKQVQYRSEAASARTYGTGSYAFDWNGKPGERGEKASKERAAFEAQLEALDVPKEKWAGAWEKYKVNRKAK